MDGASTDGVASAFRRTVASASARAIDALLAVILAPACAACDAPLEEPSRGPICGRCWRQIVPITPPVCDGCGDPLQSWRVISLEQGVCPRCRRRRHAATRSRAIGLYEGSLRGIVHALKYDGRRSVARPLATLMVECGRAVLEGVDVAVPVPLHRSRQRARGFNQAYELARHLGPPVVRALRRVRATPSQTDLPEARRHANVRGAFALARSAPVRGLCVLLVDDVSTTGATLEACARVLREAGAREVRALTAARVASQRR
jgi:ComF family protein